MSEQSRPSHGLSGEIVLIDSGIVSAGAAEQIIRQLGQLDEEQKAMIRRTINRLTQISILAIGATSESLINLQTERNALIATLASLGEEKAQVASAKAEAFVWYLLGRALDVALGKLI